MEDDVKRKEWQSSGGREGRGGFGGEVLIQLREIRERNEEM